MVVFAYSFVVSIYLYGTYHQEVQVFRRKLKTVQNMPVKRSLSLTKFVVGLRLCYATCVALPCLVLRNPNPCLIPNPNPNPNPRPCPYPYLNHWIFKIQKKKIY
jgi:hypothetical protein